MKTWLYSWIAYPTLFSLAFFFGFFSKKTRGTLKLRSWKYFLSLRFNVGEPIEYWVHVASYGELEYAFPILQELEKKQRKVLVTYYSVSAKEMIEKLPSSLSNVSLIVPLPHDGLGLMKEFVALVKKQGVRNLLLLKYELWPGLLWECNRQNIAVVLVDALKPSWFHRNLLHKLSSILAGYASEIEHVQHPDTHVVGDTRVERVMSRLKNSKDSPLLEDLKASLNTKPILVCGSMWPVDTDLVYDAFNSALSSGHVLWIPHELSETECKRACKLFKSLGYEIYDLNDFRSKVVNTNQSMFLYFMQKGLLAELYKVGHLTYVGGGFGAGVHSVWEPALTGAYVACGPKTSRSPEAFELEKHNILRRVWNSQQFLNWYSEHLTCPKTEQYLKLTEKHIGASKRVVDYCENRFFTEHKNVQ